MSRSESRVAKVGLEVGRSRESAAIETSPEDVGRFARNHDRHGLAVFVDEFQESRLGDRRSLLIALQHFDGAPDGCPVVIVSAWLPSMLGAVPEAATFGERTDFVQVNLLSDVAVAEAVRLPSLELPVTWSDEAILAAIDLAAGYPHQVQFIGDATWQAARPDKSNEIGVGQVRQGAAQVEQRMANHFRSRLAKATEEQRRFITAMAALSDGSASRSDIADRLGVMSGALSRARQELIDRALIEPVAAGCCVLPSPASPISCASSYSSARRGLRILTCHRALQTRQLLGLGVR